MANNPQTPSTRAEVDDPTVRGCARPDPANGGTWPRVLSPSAAAEPWIIRRFGTSGGQDTTGSEAPNGLHSCGERSWRLCEAAPRWRKAAGQSKTPDQSRPAGQSRRATPLFALRSAPRNPPPGDYPSPRWAAAAGSKAPMSDHRPAGWGWVPPPNVAAGSALTSDCTSAL